VTWLTHRACDVFTRVQGGKAKRDPFTNIVNFMWVEPCPAERFLRRLGHALRSVSATTLYVCIRLPVQASSPWHSVASISRAPMLTSARWLAWQHVAVRDHIVL